LASAFLGRSGSKICRPPGTEEHAATASAIAAAAALPAAGLHRL
jgi:hypothetical protein